MLTRAVFHASVGSSGALPHGSVAEVAFAGRSNVGKSSAINCLTRRRRLAFVSKTPGRTQTINFYSLGDSRYLVDLPGYGYARAPEQTRLGWQRLIGGYLGKRDALRGLIIIMDIRHPMRPLDAQLLDWFYPTGKPIHVLLAKTDKLSRREAEEIRKEVEAAITRRYPAVTLQLFSSITRLGVEVAEQTIVDWLGRAEIKSPQLKGRKTGGQNALIGIKAPAQGGEAGDGSSPSAG